MVAGGSSRLGLNSRVIPPKLDRTSALLFGRLQFGTFVFDLRNQHQKTDSGIPVHLLLPMTMRRQQSLFLADRSAHGTHRPPAGQLNFRTMADLLI
jgi:hypothetical protein